MGTRTFKAQEDYKGCYFQSLTSTMNGMLCIHKNYIHVAAFARGSFQHTVFMVSEITKEGERDTVG